MEEMLEFDSLKQKANEANVRVDVVKIGLVCPACGHRWGIRIRDLENLDNINRKFICFECVSKTLMQ